MRKKESMRPRLNYSDDHQLLCMSYYHHNDFNLILPGEDDLSFPLMVEDSSDSDNDNDTDEKVQGETKEEESPPVTPLSQVAASHSTGHEDDLLLLDDVTLDDVTISNNNNDDDDSRCDATVLEEDTQFISPPSPLNVKLVHIDNHKRKNIVVGRFPSISSTQTDDESPLIIVDDWDVLTAMENLKKDIICGSAMDIGMSSMSTATTTATSNNEWDAVSSVNSVLSMDTFQTAQTAKSGDHQHPKKASSQTYKEVVQKNSTNEECNDKAVSTSTNTTITKSNSSSSTMMIPIIESTDSNDSSARDNEESYQYDERDGYKYARGGKNSMMFRKNDTRRAGREKCSAAPTGTGIRNNHNRDSHGNGAIPKISTKNRNGRKQDSSGRDISTY